MRRPDSSYEGKKTVQIRYHIGFERMIRMAVENFRELGLEPIIARASIGTRETGWRRARTVTMAHRRTASTSMIARYDNAVYLDKAFRERKLSILKVAYETYKDLASVYAGPAVVETFGEAGFEPVNAAAAFSLSEKQEKLLLSTTAMRRCRLWTRIFRERRRASQSLHSRFRRSERSLRAIFKGDDPHQYAGL
ncbi:MAG: hypothetical protein ACLR8P_16720 [Clostridium fessum]